MVNQTQTKGRNARWTVAEAALWLLLCAGAYAMTFEFDGPLPTYELGPAFWPRMLIAGIALSAVGLMVGPFLPRGDSAADIAPRAQDPAAADTPEDAGRAVTMETVAVLLIPIAYVYCIHQFGFYLATPFFFAGYMYLLGVHNWVTLTVVTVCLYAVIVLVFVHLIFTPLPEGAGVFHTLNGQFIALFQ